MFPLPTQLRVHIGTADYSNSTVFVHSKSEERRVKRNCFPLELPQSKGLAVPVATQCAKARNDLSSRTNHAACTFIRLCQALSSLLEVRNVTSL